MASRVWGGCWTTGAAAADDRVVCRGMRLGGGNRISVGIGSRRRELVLAREEGVGGICFGGGGGGALPFGDNAFDTVFSHAVIEHVADPLHTTRNPSCPETRRAGVPSDRVLFSSAARLPRLGSLCRCYLFLGRRVSFRLARWLAATWPASLDAPPDGSIGLTSARKGEEKPDDLLYRVTVREPARIGGGGLPRDERGLLVQRPCETRASCQRGLAASTPCRSRATSSSPT